MIICFNANTSYSLLLYPCNTACALNHLFSVTNKVGCPSVARLGLHYCYCRSSRGPAEEEDGKRMFRTTEPPSYFSLPLSSSWAVLQSLGLLSYSPLRPSVVSGHLLCVIVPPENTDLPLTFHRKTKQVVPLLWRHYSN